ncbi:DUF4214 domain-containing protein [Massilia oculi]|uniref:DUF4214 domain-containing protein n=1 Tax=Massilia oculi TaxID=945844 RepID=UPI0028AFC595|nr:DUF4214 domain-containing protein [Massilia oculi]
MSTFSTYDSTVNSFYLAFYGRPADPAGLKFWSEQLANNNGELGAITQAFATSEEAQVRFGTDSVNERIAEIYQQLFNHTPDTDGLAYWTEVVEQGRASMADVAIAILKGAQGSDATLSQLRQQAVDAFTAQVEAGGTEYSGYASIEAARILVRAVTPDATTADLDVLVKAAVSFADTATKTPQVVEAIAVNTTLLALFDTARGTKEPVALAKALADTAKAAAGDPVTLESLLRGGGMDKVLKVMPTKATLQDVVDALGSGGLPAAVEVVYPTAPSTPSIPSPTFSLELSFGAVTQDKFDLNFRDNITNQSTADVTFTYVGRDLRPGQHFEYSLDGVNYTDKNIETSAETNTVVLKGVQLGYPQHITTFVGGSPDVSVTTPEQTLPILPTLPTLPNVPNLDPFNKVTTIYLRAADSSGAHTTPLVQKIVYDGFVAEPLVALKNDTFHKDLGSNTDLVTRDGTLDVTMVEPDAKVEYVVIAQQPQKIVGPFGSNTDFDQPPVNAEWSEAPQYEQGLNTVWVRVTDIAGNQSFRKFEFTLDSVEPETPTIKLHSSTTDSSSSLPVSDGQIDISGLEFGQDSAWEYSLDGGEEWIVGDKAANIHGEATLNVTGTGAKSVLVRQFDSAGNVSAQTDALEFTIAEQGSVEVRADQYGIEVKQTGPGTLVIAPLSSTLAPIPLFNGGLTADGWTKVAALEDPVTGVVGIQSLNGSVLPESKEYLYTLGSSVKDTITGSHVYGFGGDDTITGTDGDDYLSGGDGNDTIDGGLGNNTIIGGAGGDTIFAGGGNNRIVIGDASESSLGYLNGNPAYPMWDRVQIMAPNKIVFDFNANVTSAYNQSFDLMPTSVISNMYVAINAAYTAAAKQEGGAAVMMTGQYGTNFLVVDNGDHHIDEQDIVVQVVGFGMIEVDPNGNIVFDPAVS